LEFGAWNLEFMTIPDMSSFGKTLIILGMFLIVFGVLFLFGGKLSWLGRLPGDVYMQKKGFSLYFPIMTSLVVSVVLSVIFMLLRRR
jgi:uncharacterized membrane protein YidH (DUF202 family)